MIEYMFNTVAHFATFRLPQPLQKPYGQVPAAKRKASSIDLSLYLEGITVSDAVTLRPKEFQYHVSHRFSPSVPWSSEFGMIDTVSYVIGYEPSFTFTPAILPRLQELNPLVHARNTRHGFGAYWPDFTDQTPASFSPSRSVVVVADSESVHGRRRVNPETGELYSSCRARDWQGLPLGRICFYPTAAFVSVELPRVLFRSHNAYLISCDQAQMAFEAHLLALQAEFPFLSTDYFRICEIDCYYQNYSASDPKDTLFALHGHYVHNAVAPSGVKDLQRSHLIDFHWCGSRDGKFHYFNAYDKSYHLLVCEGLPDLACDSYGLVRVSERVSRKDRHMSLIWDEKARRFRPDGVASLLRDRYHNFYQGGEVSNYEDLVRKYGPETAEALITWATSPARLSRMLDYFRLHSTPASFRSRRSRTRARLRSVELTGGQNPFHIPPVSELADLFAAQTDPFVLPLGQVKPPCPADYSRLSQTAQGELDFSPALDHDPDAETFSNVQGLLPKKTSKKSD